MTQDPAVVPKTLTPLQHWMRLASVEEQEQLATLAGTSREYLYQLGVKDRRASSAMAGRIERAVDKINARSASRDILPRVPRTSLADACAECEYARRCLGETALAGAFDTTDTADMPQRARAGSDDAT